MGQTLMDWKTTMLCGTVPERAGVLLGIEGLMAAIVAPRLESRPELDTVGASGTVSALTSTQTSGCSGPAYRGSLTEVVL